MFPELENELVEFIFGMEKSHTAINSRSLPTRTEILVNQRSELLKKDMSGHSSLMVESIVMYHFQTGSQNTVKHLVQAQITSDHKMSA